MYDFSEVNLNIVDVNPENCRVIHVLCKDAYVDSSGTIFNSSDVPLDGEMICHILSGCLHIEKKQRLTSGEAMLFSRAGVKFITRAFSYSNHQLRLWDGELRGDFGQYEPCLNTKMIGVLPAAALPEIQPGECIEVSDWL